MRVQVWSAGLAACAALLLSACSGDPGRPTTLPSLTPTPTASPSTTPTPGDLAAATQVVREYYALLNAQTSAAQAARLRELMDASCTCQEIVESIEGALRSHQHFFGTNIVRSVVPTLDGPRNADVLVTYDYTRSGVVDSHGRVVSAGPGRVGTTQDFRLARKNLRWVITTILRVNAGRQE